MTQTGGIASERLKDFVTRIERLEEEKQALAEDIKDVKAEARQAGFDVKTINRLIRRRRMTADERDEEDALLEIYEGALGMLSDTPLGEAARRRLSRKPTPERPVGGKPSPDDGEDGEGDAPAAGDPWTEPAADPLPGVTIEQAREMGAEAARNGEPVTANPFPAADPRRAAWDEGWCKADGSDGMEIPEAWRRKKPAKGDGKPPRPEGGDAPDDDPEDR